MKNKLITPITVAATLALALLCACLFTGCSSLKHVDAAEFKQQIELDGRQSLYWTEYIGQADGRAFLLRKRVPMMGKKLKVEVLFTEIDKLGEDFVRELEER
jgi:hypothetical protein